ncbi:RNA polymerase sigma factor [Sorangium sp. So ce394]|uniref:RNA polymerase sigma factor n=1 Tax=Sorangium sp. So ce394 TaxID=3133310 RepID=UPI003F5C7104
MIKDNLCRLQIPECDHQDVMQEILLSAWHTVEVGGFHASEHLSVRQAVRRWLFVVTWHHITHYREREQKWEKGRDAYTHPAIDEYAPPPFGQVEARLSLRCMERLKPEVREVLADSALGYTAEEIAARLGQNPNTIQGRLERGREQLRRTLRSRNAATPLAIRSMLASMSAF